MSFMDKLKEFFYDDLEEDDFEPMPPSTHELEPIELMQHAVNSVAHGAKEWPDGIDLPDTVEIWISLQDYEYFGPRKATCEKRMGEAIVQYAADANALLERTPTVILRVDPALTMGDTRAKAYFTNPDDPAPQGAGPMPAHTIPLDDTGIDADPASMKTCCFVKPAPSSKLDTVCMAAPVPTGKANAASASTDTGTGTGGNPRAAACAGEPSAANSTPALKPNRTLTPELEPSWIPAIETAQLIDGDRRIEVIDGDTVGCLRQIGEPAPAIALDETSHPYVSQHQAEFTCKNSVWALVSHGRNGTSVQREGTWTDLAVGAPFELHDGDRISFARSAPLTFSLR